MVASLQVLRKGMQLFVFLCIISDILSPENLKCYYIQPGRTIGNKSDVNLPTFTTRNTDSLFGPSPWTWDLIPEADPKQQRSLQRGRRSGLLIRLRRRAHHPPLPSILLANVQSLDNKVDEIRASEIVTFSVSRKHGSLGICCRCLYIHHGFFMHHADINKHLSGKKKGSPFVHLT